ncbi:MULTISPECIES: hypothetical protein [Streptomycetaceae]|uniref:hypothetical protein n=1 Tax=Streptomycetaceae TaxID=2062 RepID=UPI00093A806D|nr:hypothetical protein [Streptomyces sp. CB02056]OKI08814.1 hypothetical protein AMK13_10485 [Streptomyces sp. CB02056]
MSLTAWAASLRAALHHLTEVARLRTDAACLGLARARADAVLAEAQGTELGIPTADHFDAARRTLWAEFATAHPAPAGDPLATLTTTMTSTDQAGTT